MTKQRKAKGEQISSYRNKYRFDPKKQAIQEGGEKGNIIEANFVISRPFFSSVVLLSKLLEPISLLDTSAA